MNHKKLKEDLKAYCTENFCNRSQLARKAGISISHMHNVLNGMQNSGTAFWTKIENATDGAIKRGDYE